ncbi:hypothetical protein BAE44_0020916 [Dichanthelium oligosanthes]|uniref:Pectinesterase catalytic domain-containing protein n=1 Tax=Dichanthelium oligosanthes TaxID=888268 RepID=A0A1E5UZ49_9POAL|nr:hypothetical protein BAE44_0020916 [Dichanthelium oligosanthes]
MMALLAAALLALAVLGVASCAFGEGEIVTTHLPQEAGRSGGDHARCLLSSVPAASSWPPGPHAVVAKQCGGGGVPCYATIQGALDAAPPEGGEGVAPAGPPLPAAGHDEVQRYVVHVLDGVYEESLNITKKDIGEGIGVTVITGNKSNGTGTPMNTTATVSEYYPAGRPCFVLHPRSS